MFFILFFNFSKIISSLGSLWTVHDEKHGSASIGSGKQHRFIDLESKGDKKVGQVSV